jgi:hypothetical protein
MRKNLVFPLVIALFSIIVSQKANASCSEGTFTSGEETCWERSCDYYSYDTYERSCSCSFGGGYDTMTVDYAWWTFQNDYQVTSTYGGGTSLCIPRMAD